ncbi:MAG: glycosyltransferase [Chloroflexi bacterium]|nr:glycosyltransferase [Chloroflexota bacterium]
MAVERVSDAARLRIAVLGDFDGVHTRAWLRWFIERGHDVHAISYYAPAAPLDGVTLHVLKPGRRAAASGVPSGAAGGAGSRVPRGLLRLLHGARYRMAGLPRVLRAIGPDVFHAHFLVEHGFYGALAGFHPYVVTAWGSDVLVEPQRDPVSKQIARWTMRRADLLTSNNEYMAEHMAALGAPRSKIEVVTLGADRSFLDAHEQSVNVRGRAPGEPRCVLSTRAHEPLYNIHDVIDASARVARSQPDVRLAMAHGGTLTAGLQRRAQDAAGRVEFLGFLDSAALREAMTEAEVFVSVPSSDGTSVALLQAMAAGCFPIVSDLPTQRELVEDGVNGFRVPPHRPEALAERIARALSDPDLRRRAAAANRALVERRGLNETEMARMEAAYRRLAAAHALTTDNRQQPTER